MEVGMLGINNAGLSSPSVPFGGVKESGIGREGGQWGLEEYLEVKYVGIGYETPKP
jgi:succinate-semialdehyde dehydrogenase / glutarate-semialdehyde dehydrogenase